MGSLDEEKTMGEARVTRNKDRLMKGVNNRKNCMCCVCMRGVCVGVGGTLY